MQGIRDAPGVIPRVVRVRIHLQSRRHDHITTIHHLFLDRSHTNVSNKCYKQALFEQKEFVEAHDDVSLSISYMEIYKDECYDLLVDRDTVCIAWLRALSEIRIADSRPFVFRNSRMPFVPQAPKLPVRENDVGQVFVANLSQIPIDSAEEFDNLYS